MNAKRYVYPRSMLEQRRYMAFGGAVPAQLDASMLSCEHFESPILDLLANMTVDGHDVSGPLAEYVACCEAIKHLSDAIRQIQSAARTAMNVPSSMAVS